MDSTKNVHPFKNEPTKYMSVMLWFSQPSLQNDLVQFVNSVFVLNAGHVLVSYIFFNVLKMRVHCGKLIKHLGIHREIYCRSDKKRYASLWCPAQIWGNDPISMLQHKTWSQEETVNCSGFRCLISSVPAAILTFWKNKREI